MFDYQEIERTVRDNRLPLLKIEGKDKDELLQNLYDRFVIGNPRALWLSFKYTPERIDCNMEDPYWHLPDIIDRDTPLYLIIDYWNTDFVIYKGLMSDIYTFIGDCDGLDEFYLMTIDMQELYSVTDHDDLYHIDIRSKDSKVPHIK